MPCRDDRYEYQSIDQNTEWVMHRSRVAEYLCTLCKSVGEGLLPPEVRAWWKEHKRLDQAKDDREQAEQRRRVLRRTAKEKLTEEERKALGIYE